MKKTGFHKAKLFIAVLLFSLVAIFMFQGNVLLEMCSRLFVRAETVSTENEGINAFASQEIEGFSATYKVNDIETSETSLTREYDASKFVLSVKVSATTATNFTYQWCHTSLTGEYSILPNETSNNISLRNVSQSGKYCCIVTNADNAEESCVSSDFTVNITAKEVSLTTVKAIDKNYDGTTEINLSTDEDLFLSGDQVEVTGLGHTATPIADQNKLVTIESIKLFGNDAENYKLNTTNLSQKNIFVNINKLPIVFSWGTTKTNFTYNGQDQILSIAPYYLNHVGERIDLNFSIEGFNLNANTRYTNEFLNAGTYTATVLLTENESNYDLTDKNENGDKKITLVMNRANSVISVKDLTFIYNGLQQDAGRCAYLNNDEQTLTFENNLFTTVKEGNNLTVVARAAESLNYLGSKTSYTIEVLKATSTINVDGVVKDYVYTGSKQTIEKGATINNSEQSLVYKNNSFVTVNEGNALKVTVSALATENYNSTSETFTINVSKANIDTSKWYWHYIENVSYTGNTYSVELVCDTNLVTVTYTDAAKKDAGIYVAKAKLTLIDNNYNPVTFGDLVWEIKKANLTKPNCERASTVYTGEVQTLDIPTSIYYTTENKTQINAGTYQVIFTINQPKNYQWSDGTIASLTKLWTIEKQVVAKPQVENEFFYDGEEKTIALTDTNLYSVIKDSNTEIGEYSAYLILKDPSNYKWAEEYGSVATLTWKILPKENPSTIPMLAIIFSCIVIVLIAVVATLHSTSVIKKRRSRKKAEKKEVEKTEKPLADKEKQAEKEVNKTNKTVTASTRIIRKKPKTKTKKQPKPKTEKKEKTVKANKKQKAEKK